MEGSEKKKFYWIKLRTDFFQEDSPIDFLMSQDNGAQYVVLYQMLCLKTANTQGELSTRIGEMIIPYDVKKIVRDTKYFDVDTVTVALELFKHLGLVYEQENGTLRIANYQHMIGSESASKEAIKKRSQREKLLGDIKGDNLSPDNRDTKVDEMSDRDKSIENRDIEIRDINFLSSTKVDDCPSLKEEPQQRYVYQDIVDKWNTLAVLGVQKINKIPEGSPRVPLLRKRLKEYGEDSFDRIIDEIRNSDFLLGKVQSKGKEPFNLSFDWVIKPSNYPKIHEGKYRNKASAINNMVQQPPIERFKGYE